jgi:Protein of unknown function (DUF4231)
MQARTGRRESAPVTTGPTWDRLEDQLGWYDRKSIAAQRMYKRLKLVQLAVTAAVPVAAASDAKAWVTAALGAIVLVLEGLQQLGQYQQNWIAYRSTCESLKHEKYLYLAHAGPYADAASATRTLAERLEGLVSQEHAKWISAREEAAAAPTAAPS